MRVATLLLSLHWMPAVADVICSYVQDRLKIDQGERVTLRSFEQCNIVGYVNLRWHMDRLETLESGHILLYAQFANHGLYWYFEIDGLSLPPSLLMQYDCVRYGYCRTLGVSAWFTTSPCLK